MIFKITTLISVGVLLLGCQTTAANKNSPKGESGVFAGLERCAADKMPEGVLAVGLAVTVPSPMAPLAAAGYYSAVMYKCKTESNQSDDQHDSKLTAVKKELNDKIEANRAAIIKSTAAQISDLGNRVDHLKASEAENMNKMRTSAAKIAQEAEVEIRRSADEAIQSVYKQMDEIRRVKIQVIDDSDE